MELGPRRSIQALLQPPRVIRIYCTKPQRANKPKSLLNGLFHHSVFHLADDEFSLAQVNITAEFAQFI